MLAEIVNQILAGAALCRSSPDVIVFENVFSLSWLATIFGAGSFRKNADVDSVPSAKRDC